MEEESGKGEEGERNVIVVKGKTTGLGRENTVVERAQQINGEGQVRVCQDGEGTPCLRAHRRGISCVNACAYIYIY